MSVKFKSVKRRNPLDASAPEKYYATAVSDGSTDFKELADMVASQSTASPADCHAVLIALESNIIRELHKGKIIRFGDIGSFSLSVKSEGKDTTEEVNSNSIKRSKLNFRPGKGLKQMLKTLEFTKIQDQVA